MRVSFDLSLSCILRFVRSLQYRYGTPELQSQTGQNGCLITCFRDLERRKETLPTLPDLPDSHAETELLGELESTCNELCTYM